MKQTADGWLALGAAVAPDPFLRDPSRFWGFGGEATNSNGCAEGAPFVSFFGVAWIFYPQAPFLFLNLI